MGILELFVLAIGLSMDAFAVSICKGLSVQKLELKHMLIVGAYFGGFQALMPAIGYVLGSQFEHLIVSVDHWIAFFLLLFIGGNMIKESRENDVDDLDDDFGVKTMLLLAIATSIDAVAVGASLAFVYIAPLQTAFVTVMTFIFTALACYIGITSGEKIGCRVGAKATLLGGAVLILIGVKILAEHLFF